MSIGIKQYQKMAMRTSPRDGHDKIDNGVLGLIGETGELVDVYKKWMYQSGPAAELPAKQIADELGDILWYLAELSDGMGMDLIDINGNDFAALDARVKRKPAKKTKLRNMIVSLSGSAYMLERTVSRCEWRATGNRMRRMLISMAHIAGKAGTTLGKVAEMNINKLKKSYPNGFDARISMERYE